MKTLSGHTILYDADCPLCRVYTGAFVKTGMLDREGRQPFQQLPDAWRQLVDTERAQSEIALVDKGARKVYYGVDALALILSHRMPWLQPLFGWRPFRWLAQRAYFLISYNRKVIAAVRPHPGSLQSCTPAFNVRYRVAYLLLALLITAITLHRYAPLLSPLLPAGGFCRELAVAAGQIIFQGVLVALLDRRQVLEYLGHMMTVSLIGSLLLLPPLLLSPLLPGAAPLFFAAWFLLTAGFMLLEHMRRMKLLRLGLLPSMGWVVYRMLVLGFLLGGF